MATYRYPLDILGTSPSNRVTQTRTLNMTTKMGDKFFIPENAPFFAEGCEIYKVGSPTPLVRGIDYELIFNFPDIFQITEKNIYGGVKFKNRNISGQVRIDAQILGGPFLQPVQNILETIARNKTNVNTATWGELAGVPAGFPVLDHTMISDDEIGYGEINTTLRDIAALLAGMTGGGTGGDGTALALIRSHISNPTNAHNKSAVGLSNVPNFALSTYEEADLGVNNRLVSPALTKYLISKYSGLQSITSIQQQVNIINRDILVLQQGLQENNINVGNLDDQVTSLNNQFENVRLEFANILIYVNDLGGSIENIQNLIQDTKLQVEEALIRVSEMESIVNQIQFENGNISSELLRINTDLNGLSNRTDALETTMLTMALSIAKINNAVLYPIRRFIQEGSYHFSVSPGETRQITLIGTGGAGGIVIPLGQDGVVEPRGAKGGDTVLVLNTDITNGINSAGEIVLRADGGYGGQCSKQSAGGIDYFGKSGPGGNTAYTGLFNIISNSIGAGGVDGNGSVGPSHAGAIGHQVQGKTFGSGGAAPIAAATGSAGAKIVAKITNTFNFDLEFTVKVGEAPHNILTNNYTPAAPGLFIIEIT